MISQAFSLMGSMYDAIGPGLVLVAALPISAIGLALVVRSGLKRGHADR
jgi:hypothetical protein